MVVHDMTEIPKYLNLRDALLLFSIFFKDNDLTAAEVVGDDGTTDFSKISFKDPISMQRLEYPCRGMRCKHLQCFSYSSYLFLNKNKKRAESQYVCPICNAACSRSKLFLDPIVDCLLTMYPSDDHVNVYKDGTFLLSPQPSHSKAQKSSKNATSSVAHKEPIFIDLVDDDDDEVNVGVSSNSSLPSSANPPLDSVTSAQAVGAQKRISVASLLADIAEFLGKRHPLPDPNSIEAISRVRLSDVLFFINNAPKEAFLRMMAGRKFMKPEQLYDKVVKVRPMHCSTMTDLRARFSTIQGLKKKVIEIFMELIKNVLSNEFQHLLQPSPALLNSPFIRTLSHNASPLADNVSKSSLPGNSAVATNIIQSSSAGNTAVAMQPNNAHGSLQNTSAITAGRVFIPRHLQYESNSSQRSGTGGGVVPSVGNNSVGSVAHSYSSQSPYQNMNTAMEAQSKILQKYEQRAAGVVTAAPNYRLTAAAAAVSNSSSNSTRPPIPPMPPPSHLVASMAQSKIAHKTGHQSSDGNTVSATAANPSSIGPPQPRTGQSNTVVGQNPSTLQTSSVGLFHTDAEPQRTGVPINSNTVAPPKAVAGAEANTAHKLDQSSDRTSKSTIHTSNHQLPTQRITVAPAAREVINPEMQSQPGSADVHNSTAQCPSQLSAVGVRVPLGKQLSSQADAGRQRSTIADATLPSSETNQQKVNTLLRVPHTSGVQLNRSENPGKNVSAVEPSNSAQLSETNFTENLHVRAAGTDAPPHDRAVMLEDIRAPFSTDKNEDDGWISIQHDALEDHDTAVVPVTAVTAKQPNESGNETVAVGSREILSEGADDHDPSLQSEREINYNLHCGISALSKPKLNKRRMSGRAIVENVEPLKRRRVETDSSAPLRLSDQEVTRIKETQKDENVVLLRPDSEITNNQNTSTTSYEGSSRDEERLGSQTQQQQQQQHSYRAQTLTQSQERVYRYEVVERYVRDTTLVSEVANDTLSFQSSESLNDNDGPISEPFHSIPDRDDVERNNAPPPQPLQDHSPRVAVQQPNSQSSSARSSHQILPAEMTSGSKPSQGLNGGPAAQNHPVDAPTQWIEHAAATHNNKFDGSTGDIHSQNSIVPRSMREVGDCTTTSHESRKRELEPASLQLPTPFDTRTAPTRFQTSTQQLQELHWRQKLESNFNIEIEPLNLAIRRLESELHAAGSDPTTLSTMQSSLLMFKSLRDNVIEKYRLLLQQPQFGQLQSIANEPKPHQFIAEPQYFLQGQQMAQLQPQWRHPQQEQEQQQQQQQSWVSEGFTPNNQQQYPYQYRMIPPPQHPPQSSALQYQMPGPYAPHHVVLPQPHGQYHSSTQQQQQQQHHYGNPLPSLRLQQNSEHHRFSQQQQTINQGQPPSQQQLLLLSGNASIDPFTKRQRVEYHSNEYYSNDGNSGNGINGSETHRSSRIITSDSSLRESSSSSSTIPRQYQAARFEPSNRVSHSNSSSSSSSGVGNTASVVNNNSKVYRNIVPSKGQGAPLLSEPPLLLRENPNRYYKGSKQSSTKASGKPTISRLILDNLAEG